MLELAPETILEPTVTKMQTKDTNEGWWGNGWRSGMSKGNANNIQMEHVYLT